MRVACISVQKEKNVLLLGVTHLAQAMEKCSPTSWMTFMLQKEMHLLHPSNHCMLHLGLKKPLEVAATSRASSNGACYRSETRPAKPGVFGKKGLKQPKWRPTWRRPSDDVPQRSQRVATEDQGALCETVCVKSSKKHGDRSKPKPCGEHRRN